MSLGGDRVHIAFAKEHVIDTLHFHETAVLRFEENSVANLDGANIRSDRNNPRPGKTATDIGSCRDDDAAT
jgi:hypothetical protein